jgi:hypothetical protein
MQNAVWYVSHYVASRYKLILLCSVFCKKIRPRAPFARMIGKRSWSGLSTDLFGKPRMDELTTSNIERPTSKSAALVALTLGRWTFDVGRSTFIRSGVWRPPNSLRSRVAVRQPWQVFTCALSPRGNTSRPS